MCAIIEVTDRDIEYSEQILLKEGQSFDNERRDFIRNLSTLDLQAVPGSGKTTALLAKLLILERKMPFNDGSGVLVISHTNAAVDEITERIGKHTPKLFQYPNFIGTIQSFVDTFLAIPFYVNQYSQKPYRIDNEIYYEQIDKFYRTTNNYGLKVYLSNKINGLEFLKSVRISKDLRLQSYANGSPDCFKLKNPNSNSYKSIKKLKLGLLKKGYLHFDDAYTLAEFQLNNVPKYNELLQRRFKYVFVDEMQDMDVHQIKILEQIFYVDGNSISNFQRIGDKNQSIFNGSSIHIEEIWNQRELTLEINGSHRINSLMAPIVKRLGIEFFEIEGRCKNIDGTAINIKPHILIFDDDSIKNVISKYADVIRKLQENNEIPNPSPNKFMAIAWRKENDDEGKLGLSDYWDAYSHTSVKTQIDFKVLKDYLLYFDKSNKTLESVRKQILNALLKIIRLENIYDEFDRVYTKRKLLNHFRINHTSAYEVLKLTIYDCSLLCINEEIDEAYSAIKNYIPEFLSVFDSQISSSVNFINDASEIEVEEINEVEESNLFKDGEIEIGIGTVHSAKGQTHTATLYMESFFQTDGRGANAKSYESQRLCSQILGKEIDNTTLGKRVKQSLKMTYVGFSRPTHLLCFAVHKDRYNNFLQDLNMDEWEIIDITKSKRKVISTYVQFPNANKQPKL